MADNIYKKLLDVSSEITAVAKNLSVGVGKSSYKAVGEADVLAAIKPIEKKYGVYSYPYSREIIDSGEMTSTSTYNGQTTEKRNLFMRLKTVYRFINVDDPTQYVDIVTFGDGVDSQDKAPGKAMTYSDKYALLKAYKIVTGEDPDQNMSAELSSLQHKPIGETKAQALLKMLQDAGVVNIKGLCESYKVNNLSELSEKAHADIVAWINKKKATK